MGLVLLLAVCGWQADGNRLENYLEETWRGNMATGGSSVLETEEGQVQPNCISRFLLHAVLGSVS